MSALWVIAIVGGGLALALRVAAWVCPTCNRIHVGARGACAPLPWRWGRVEHDACAQHLSEGPLASCPRCRVLGLDALA